MRNTINTNKLDNFLAGDPSNEEKDYAEKLFLKGKDDPTLKKYVRNDWNHYVKNHQPTGKNLVPILNSIHHIINLKENRTGKSLGRKIYFWYSSVAAAVLIPVLAFTFYSNLNLKEEFVQPGQTFTTSEIYAPPQSRVQFSLPDGTTGWLNSKSKLEYTLPFEKNRNVKLSGEAYLDVAHNRKHPFTINVKNTDIKVLGTKLNVNAYPDNKYMEVILEQGKIEFLDIKNKIKVQMKPSEMLTYQDGEITGFVKIDPANYTTWTDGKLIFKGVPMEEVARRIGRFYNVDVILENESLKSYSFRGTFENDSLPELLKLLSMTSPIDYKIIERKVLPNGTFSKTTIILMKRKI